MVSSGLANFLWRVVIHEEMISFQWHVMNTHVDFFAPTPFSLWGEKHIQSFRHLTLCELSPYSIKRIITRKHNHMAKFCRYFAGFLGKSFPLTWYWTKKRFQEKSSWFTAYPEHLPSTKQELARSSAQQGVAGLNWTSNTPHALTSVTYHPCGFNGLLCMLCLLYPFFLLEKQLENRHPAVLSLRPWNINRKPQ